MVHQEETKTRRKRKHACIMILVLLYLLQFGEWKIPRSWVQTADRDYIYHLSTSSRLIQKDHKLISFLLTSLPPQRLAVRKSFCKVLQLIGVLFTW